MNQKSSNRETRFQRQIALIVVVCILSLFINGCSFTVPVTEDDSHPSSDVSEHAPAGEVWRALAHAVESGTVDSTTHLAQYVAVLARNGDLTEQDVAAFDAAFPHITTDSRPLTDADVTTLLGLKSKSKG